MSRYNTRFLRKCRILAVLGCFGWLTIPSSTAFAGGGKNAIKGVDSTEVDGKTTVRIHGTRTPTFTVYKLNRPARVVIDVANATLDAGDSKPTWNVNTWAVSQVSAHAKAGTGASTVRVVVGLARKSTYKVSAQGNDVTVVVTPRTKKPAGADEKMNERLREAESSARAARQEADKARAEAERTKRLARERTQQVLRRARAQADRAKAQVAEARAEAEAAQQQAKLRDAEAQRQVSSAKKMIAEASARISKAKKIEQAAKAEAERAAEREKAANTAERRADKRRAEADRAEREAAKLSERAAASADAKLRARAERAAKDAEQRRAKAESAAAAAETARKQAESLARKAELRKSEALAAVTAAERQRDQAEQSRRLAAEALEVAEQRRKDAETAASSAAARAAQFKAAAAEAERRAQGARELREREEGALRAVASKREAAERQRRAAQAAAKKVEKSLAAARRAQKLAADRRAAAERAAERAEKLAQQKSASDADIEKARAEAELLKLKLARAERDLSERNRALKSDEARVSKIAGERKKASKELAMLNKRAAAARARREKEERALAVLEKKRQVAERDLERAHVARIAAEKRLRKAEASRSASAKRARANTNRELAEAEKRLAAARTARAAAEGKLDEESRARAEAERRAERAEAEMRKAHREAKAARAVAKRAAKGAAAAEASAKAVKAEARADAAKAAAAEARARAAATADAAKAAAAEARARAAATADTKTVNGPRVSDVDFHDRDDSARVVIALSAPAKPKVISAKGKRAVLEIPNVSIADSLERTLDTSKFKGPVEAVSAYRDPGNPSKVRVVVDLSRRAKGVLKRVGNTYYWDFAKSAKRTAKTRRTKRRSGKRVARASEFPAPSVAGYGASSGPITQQTVSQLRKRRKVYRGRKIDLDFKDADIHNLLRLLADVGGVNIVIPSNIQETVTVRLRNVPWDQAMEVILASKGLWYRRQGSLIRIAPRKELDEEDEKEAARIAAMVKAEPPEPEIFTLNYAEASQLSTQLKPLLSPKGRLEVDPRTNSVIVNDIAAHRRRIIDLMTRLDTQTPQIQIEARIVEARTSFSRSFGIQWGGRATATAAGGNSTGLVFPSDVQVGGAASDGQTPEEGVLAAPPSDFAVNLPTAIGTGVGGGLGLSLGSVGGNLSLNLRLSAAEDSGSIRIISSPKVTTSNNETANIKAGTSIPISVVSASGVQTQFVPADLSLTVTPKVSQRDCGVSLDIAITKNEADFANTGARGDPSILTKEAKTIILVADGETAVIGGIYSRNTGLDYNKVPFFADLPVIGYFFKTRSETDERSETLLFITPKITNRAYLRCE